MLVPLRRDQRLNDQIPHYQLTCAQLKSVQCGEWPTLLMTNGYQWTTNTNDQWLVDQLSLMTNCHLWLTVTIDQKNLEIFWHRNLFTEDQTLQFFSVWILQYFPVHRAMFSVYTEYCSLNVVSLKDQSKNIYSTVTRSFNCKWTLLKIMHDPAHFVRASQHDGKLLEDKNNLLYTKILSSVDNKTSWYRCINYRNKAARCPAKALYYAESHTMEVGTESHTHDSALLENITRYVNQ
jgi:hypothetical protein